MDIKIGTEIDGKYYFAKKISNKEWHIKSNHIDGPQIIITNGRLVLFNKEFSTIQTSMRDIEDIYQLIVTVKTIEGKQV